MTQRLRAAFPVLLSVLLAASTIPRVRAQSAEDLDRKVRSFLESHRGTWRDMNISEMDGRYLYDLIVRKGYKKALEIGTSTGHSGIWIAWALSKTGGRLVTIEIDEGRYRKALSHFEEAGLLSRIDARLADAHELVSSLPGPFDFVFCDADKNWYKNYFIAVLPKLEVGGCFAAHNVTPGQRGRGWGTGEFLDYVESLPSLETTFAPEDWTSMSISFKKSL